MKFAIINGPNLNRLGKREPKIYGLQSWNQIWEDLLAWAQKENITLQYFQSNHEGDLIDKLQEWEGRVDGIVMNPGAYAHTSIALRDCVAGLDKPVVEVHITKTQRRESFRRNSYISDVAATFISGFGVKGYFLGLALLKYLVQ